MASQTSSNRRARQQADATAKQTVEVLTSTGVETMSVQQMQAQPDNTPGQPDNQPIVKRSFDISKPLDLAAGRIAVHKSIERFEETGEFSAILGQRFLRPVSAYVLKDMATGAVQRLLVYRAPYDVQKDVKTNEVKLNSDGSAKPKWRYYAFIKNPDGTLEATGREYVASRSDITGHLNMLVALDERVQIFTARNGKLVKTYEPAIDVEPAESEASEQA